MGKKPGSRKSVKASIVKVKKLQREKRARENLCTQKHHYITRSKRYATLRHLAAPLTILYNVIDRDVGPDTISDMFRARTRHHPRTLKLK